MLARIVEEGGTLGGEVFGDVERGDRGRNDRQRHRAEVVLCMTHQRRADGLVEADPATHDLPSQGSVLEAAQQEADALDVACLAHPYGDGVDVGDRHAPAQLRVFRVVEPVLVEIQGCPGHDPIFPQPPSRQKSLEGLVVNWNTYRVKYLDVEINFRPFIITRSDVAYSCVSTL